MSDWSNAAKAIPVIVEQNETLIVQNGRLEKWNQLLWVKLVRLQNDVEDGTGPPAPMSLELNALAAEELPELPSR